MFHWSNVLIKFTIKNQKDLKFSASVQQENIGPIISTPQRSKHLPVQSK